MDKVKCSNVWLALSFGFLFVYVVWVRIKVCFPYYTTVVFFHVAFDLLICFFKDVVSFVRINWVLIWFVKYMVKCQFVIMRCSIDTTLSANCFAPKYFSMTLKDWCIWSQTTYLFAKIFFFRITFKVWHVASAHTRCLWSTVKILSLRLFEMMSLQTLTFHMRSMPMLIIFKCYANVNYF